MTVQKVILSNPSNKEGRSTVYVDKLGNTKVLDPVVAIDAGIAAHSGVLTNKLDDVRYYTGDAVT